MPKSSEEKLQYATTLLGQGKTIREVQQRLIERYGSGMSNTTILKLQFPKMKTEDLLKRIEELENELEVFKRLYFELFGVVKAKFPGISTKIERVKVDLGLKGENEPTTKFPTNENNLVCNNCMAQLDRPVQFCPFCGFQQK